jgi:hypothetical protein
MPQDTTRILLEEAANPQNDPECFGLWMALGLRSEYHGVGIGWVQVFSAINARWGRGMPWHKLSFGPTSALLKPGRTTLVIT